MYDTPLQALLVDDTRMQQIIDCFGILSIIRRGVHPMGDEARDATRCYVLSLKCIKCDSGCGFAPDPAGGAYSALPDSLA